MSTTVAEPLTLRSAPLPLAGPAGWQALAAAFLAAGVAIGLLVPVADVSWLLIAAERMLHGQRLYADVLEVNPPLSVLLYAPAALLADGLGLRPEAVAAGLCILAILASLGLSAVILKPLIGPDPIRAWKLAAAATFVLCVMPATAFGQREHIAVIALLPAVAVSILRAEGGRPHWAPAVLAGLGFGLATAIKPHFAAMGVLPALWAMHRCGRYRPWALPELWAAALVFGGYVLSVLIWFPGYLTDVLPVLRDVYLPIRIPVWLLLILPNIPLAASSLVIARAMKLESRWFAPLMLAALGGALAYLVQGKGWLYHAYPMLAFSALGLLGAAAMAPPSRPQGWTRFGRLMLLAPPLLATWWLSGLRDPAPLARAVAQIAPPAPSLISVSSDLCVGIPLVPVLSARWVGATHSEWISDGAMTREAAGGLSPAVRARLDGLILQDRARLARDIQAGRPQVILFDRKTFDWRAWALKDPAIARDLAAYRLAGALKGVEIWILPAGRRS